MPNKTDGPLRKTILTTVIVALLTAVGAELGKTWLPNAVSFIWSKVTREEIVYVTVFGEGGRVPVVKATVSIFDQDPEKKSALDSASTDADGRAVLRNVKTRSFFLRAVYSEGSKLYTFRASYDVNTYPYRIEISEKEKWVSESIQTVGASESGSQATQSTDGPAWLKIALGELGVKESRPPAAGNPRIEEYHASTPLGRRSQDTPWACSFVSWVLTQANLTGNPKSARCADYQNFGQAISEPRVGAITVLGRSGIPEAISGQVGFLLKSDDQTVTVVAGNVDNQVSIVNYPRSRVLGFRWPN